MEASMNKLELNRFELSQEEHHEGEEIYQMPRQIMTRSKPKKEHHKK